MIFEGVPDNEKPFQKSRRRLTGLFSLILILLSIALEFHSRQLAPGVVLRNILDFMRSFITGDGSVLSIDITANVAAALAVIRNLLPALVMFRLILWIGDRLIHALYGTANLNEAGAYLRSSLFGQIVGSGPFTPSLFATLALEGVFGDLIKAGPFVIVDGGTVTGSVHQPAVRIGGPATLIVRNDSAALLERAGQLTRVLGPGLHPLRRFEKLRRVVDLRPRSYEVSVTGTSAEGLPVTLKLEVQFQINDTTADATTVTPSRPYPYSEQAVLTAASDELAREENRTSSGDWRTALVQGEAVPGLRRLIANHSLDALILSTESGKKRPMPGLKRASAPITRTKIQHDIEEFLEKHAPMHGAKLLSATLQTIEIEDDVTRQWLEHWRARYQTALGKLLAEGEAKRLKTRENARADEKRNMIIAITAALRDLASRDQPIPPELVLIRFIETYSRLAAPAWAFPEVSDPHDTLATLQRLRAAIAAGASPTDTDPTAIDSTSPRPNLPNPKETAD
jgi:regulator of protease activity HflC (stomatin/prohibitin superfamily)